MSDPIAYEHPLTGFLAATPPKAADGHTGLALHVRAPRSFLNLRGAPDAVTAALGGVEPALPGQANTVSRDGTRAMYWLGPDEWLLVCDGDTTVPPTPPAGAFVTVNDVSDGYVQIDMRGDQVRRLLAHGCTLDLHPERFGGDDCAQTALSRASVLLASAADDTIELIVRRTFADYVALWLTRVGSPYDTAFVA